MGRGGDVVAVGRADDGLGKGRGVGDALDDGGGAAARVACGIHALNVRLEGGAALLIHLHAVRGEEGAVNLLADGGDYEVTGDVEELAACDGAAASGESGAPSTIFSHVSTPSA